MSTLAQRMFTNFKKGRELISIIDEGTILEGKSCVGCDESGVLVRVVEGLELCLDCVDRIKEHISIGEPVERLDMSSVQYIIQERYTIYVDMQKLQDEADKMFGGDVIALAKSYNVGVWKVEKDKVIIQTKVLTASKKSRLNKFMIDFDGEYSTDKVAFMATPDFDGTMAPLKVKGMGIVTPPNMAQAHAQPTTPVPTPTLNRAQVQATAPVTIAPAKVPPANIKPRFICYVAGQKLEINFTDANASSYTFEVETFSGGTYDITISKADASKGEQAILDEIVNHLDSITKVFKDMYTINIMGSDFTFLVKPASLKSNQGLQYATMTTNTYLDKSYPSTVRPDDLTVNVDRVLGSATSVMPYLSDLLKQRLFDLKILPVPFTHDLLDMRLGITLKNINREDFVLEVSPSNNSLSIDISISIADFNRDLGVLYMIIEDRLKDFDSTALPTYDIGVMDQKNELHLYKATLVQGSSLINKGNLKYLVNASAGNHHFMVDVTKLKNIQGQIEDAIIKEEGYDQQLAPAPVTTPEPTVSSEKSVSNAKKEILSKKASPYKEGIFSQIAKEIKSMYISNPKETAISVTDLLLDKNDRVAQINVLATEIAGNKGDNLSDYYKGFANAVEADFKSRGVIYAVNDVGIDTTGNAYILLAVTDKNWLDMMVEQFKLDECVHLFRKNKRLGYLVESLKKRR